VKEKKMRKKKAPRTARRRRTKNNKKLTTPTKKIITNGTFSCFKNKIVEKNLIHRELDLRTYQNPPYIKEENSNKDRKMKEMNINVDETVKSIKKVIIDMKVAKHYKRLMKMKREQPTHECTENGYKHVYKNGVIKGLKKDFAGFLVTLEKYTTYEKKKTGRPKGVAENSVEMEVVRDQDVGEVYGLWTKDTDEKWKTFTFWKRMKAFEEYPEIYEKYLLFFFSNRGWSGYTVNPKVGSLVDEISLSKLMDNLPHRSPMFPKVFRE
jgi:hypothetical protein